MPCNFTKKELIRGNFWEILPLLHLVTLQNNLFSNLLFWYSTFNCQPEAHCKLLQRHSQNLFKHLRWNFFSKIVNDFKLLTVCAKSFMLDVWRGSNYASALETWRWNFLAKIVTILKALIIFEKRSNLTVWLGSKYASGYQT